MTLFKDQPIDFSELSTGLEIQSGDILLGYGNKNLTLSELINKFSFIKNWARLDQKHTDICYQWTDADFKPLLEEHLSSNHLFFSSGPQGDSLVYFNNENNKTSLGLVIKTADCIPIHIIDKHQRAVAIIHAGWKGIYNQIVPKTINHILDISKNSNDHLNSYLSNDTNDLKKGDSYEGYIYDGDNHESHNHDSEKIKASDLIIFIGPHILLDSFEVGMDVAEKVLSTIDQKPMPQSLWGYQKNESKYHISLLQVLLTQLKNCGVVLSQVHPELIDTMTDTSYHSARREPHSEGRNLSYLILRS